MPDRRLHAKQARREARGEDSVRALFGGRQPPCGSGGWSCRGSGGAGHGAGPIISGASPGSAGAHVHCGGRGSAGPSPRVGGAGDGGDDGKDGRAGPRARDQRSGSDIRRRGDGGGCVCGATEGGGPRGGAGSAGRLQRQVQEERGPVAEAAAGE